MSKKIFLDTNILKASIVSRTVLMPRGLRPSLNGEKSNGIVYGIVNICPHDKIQDKELYNEIKLLPQIANMAKRKEVELCTQMEAIIELFGLPRTYGGHKTYFDDVEIKKINAPIEYSRALFLGGISPKDSQFEFLEDIDDKRFKELQRATGAYQGENNLNRNQLLDAFHIWCAEHNGCDFYLTLDFKLMKHLNNQSKYKIETKLFRPSELLKEVRREFG